MPVCVYRLFRDKKNNNGTQPRVWVILQHPNQTEKLICGKTEAGSRSKLESVSISSSHRPLEDTSICSFTCTFPPFYVGVEVGGVSIRGAANTCCIVKPHRKVLKNGTDENMLESASKSRSSNSPVRLFTLTVLTSGGAVLILRLLLSTQCSTTNRAAQWRQDFTISLPDFPTLLSAEGDFLSLAGTHSAISNAGREKRGQTGRGRGQWQLIRRGKPGKRENKEEKEGKNTLFLQFDAPK